MNHRHRKKKTKKKKKKKGKKKKKKNRRHIPPIRGVFGIKTPVPARRIQR
jgi:hypothetical protein